MRIRVSGIDSEGKEHFIAIMDDWNVTRIEFETDCILQDLRKQHFKKIVIEREEQ